MPPPPRHRAAVAALALPLLLACGGGTQGTAGTGSAGVAPPSPPGAAAGSSSAPPAATVAPSPPMSPGPTPPAQAPPPSGERPVGAPKHCPGDDGTGAPLVPGSFPSTIALDDARRELEGTNEICGDTWCEGSFEWFFYDLRSAPGKTEMTMRAYARNLSPKGATAAKVVVRGPRYTGRVVGEHLVASCTTPCEGFSEKPRWSPCLALDLRCELEAAWRPNDGSGLSPWEKAFIDCGIALERAVRAIHPEFAGGE